MKKSRALVDNRREKVLGSLRNNGLVKVGELAEEFQVSPLTIRRDLQYLEEHKKLERFYGGATMAVREQETCTAEDGVSIYSKKIAQYAASLVEDGDTIFINGSMTALQLIKYLGDKKVIVVTNNGRVLNMEYPSNVSVILCGGELRDRKDVMVGEFAASSLSKVTAKKSFLGCGGLSPECGMTTENLSEVNINDLMLSRVAGRSYILADNGKFGNNCSFVSFPTERIKNIITDEYAPVDIVDEFREKQVNVIRISKDMEF